MLGGNLAFLNYCPADLSGIRRHSERLGMHRVNSSFAVRALSVAGFMIIVAIGISCLRAKPRAMSSIDVDGIRGVVTAGAALREGN